MMRKEICQKNNPNRAYYATNKTVKKFTTDFDNFPYSRWYRGQNQESRPVIIDREAGYNRIHDCFPVNQVYYNKTSTQEFANTHNLFDLCWETACSTVMPCTSKQIDYKGAKIANTNNNIIISP